MVGEEVKTLGEQFARLDEALSGIHATQVRQEKALVDIFKEYRETGAKIASLETVIRMSLAEQNRINKGVDKDICKIKDGWATKEGLLDVRMRLTERRISWFAGGAAVALIVFDMAFRFVVMWIKTKIS